MPSEPRADGGSLCVFVVAGDARVNASSVEYTCDSLSRVLTETQGDNPLSTEAMTVTCAYDAEGNLTQIDYP